MQVTDYYPFGLVMNQEDYFASGVLSNKYLYNNKELRDDELAGNSLGWYDYGARFYDPELARWHSIDPLAEKYNTKSPFSYASNNPVNFIDPDGMRIEWGDMSKEDKKMARKAIKYWRRSSSEYRQVWKTLKKSDYTYKIKTGETVSGFPEFKGNHKTTMPGLPDEETGKTSTYVLSDGDPGGTITFNTDVFEIGSPSFNQKVDYSKSGALEEIVHAAQYDLYVHKYGQNYNNLPGYGDYETEAKTINGIIKQEAGTRYSTGSDRILERYGAGLINANANIGDYFNISKKWLDHPKTHKMYKDMEYKWTKPKLLMKILRK